MNQSMMKKTNRKIVLALHPNPLGFGYAFLENPQEPWDCGMVRIRPVSNRDCMKRIKGFIDYYEPVLVIIGTPEDNYSFKGIRVKSLINEIAEFTKGKGIEVKQYSREDIRVVFEQFGAKSKYEIAKKIIEWLPQFANKLPEVKKPWMAEDYKMGMFDALSLAITHFYLNE